MGDSLVESSLPILSSTACSAAGRALQANVNLKFTDMDTKESERPFSIAWWLRMNDQSIAKALGAYSVWKSVDSKTYIRYKKLSEWIKKRILTKANAPVSDS